MMRLIAFLVVLAPVTYAALWVAERHGLIRIEWQGYLVETHVSVAVGVIAFAFILLLGAAFMLRRLIAYPSELARTHELSRYRRGVMAINRTMAALALGDAKEAQKQLNKTKHLLRDEPETGHLLGIQVARASGNESQLTPQLEAMMEHPITKPIGLRGQILARMRDGDYFAALDFAREAWKGRHHDAWLASILVQLQCHQEEWQQLDHTLDQARRKGTLNRQEVRHIRALMHVQRGIKGFAQDDPNKAERAVDQSLKEQPDLLPAHLLKAELAAQNMEAAKFVRLIEKSWSVEPHPKLADLLLEKIKDTPAKKREKYLRNVQQRQPDHIESMLLTARFAIEEGNWQSARNALKVALTHEESGRIYRLLATVERGEPDGSETTADSWMNRAVNAPKDPGWVCDACGHVHENWQLFCAQCQSFDQIGWQSPDAWYPLRNDRGANAIAPKPTQIDLG